VGVTSIENGVKSWTFKGIKYYVCVGIYYSEVRVGQGKLISAQYRLCCEGLVGRSSPATPGGWCSALLRPSLPQTVPLCGRPEAEGL
jgi:hypothetical protein